MGTRVATDFQKPSEALCRHSISRRQLGTQLVMGPYVWGQGPKCVQTNEKQDAGMMYILGDRGHREQTPW